MPTLGGKLRHLAASESSLARQVRAALVSTLYTSPASLAIGAIAGSVTAACIAYVTGSLALLICSIAIHLVGVLRIASAIIYLRGEAKGSPREQLHWERIYEIGAWFPRSRTPGLGSRW